MAWTAPMTAVANTAFTAAQFNTHVRDNLLETAPAKATTANAFFSTTGTNAITERIPQDALVSATQSTSSAFFTDLSTVGPTVTVTTGTKALVILSAEFSNNSGNSSYMGFEVTGASSWDPDNDRLLRQQGTDNISASFAIRIALNAGSNTFQAKYRVAGGTGTWSHRRIIVYPF